MKTILDLALANNGIITTAMAVKQGFSRGSLKYLVDKEKLEKVARGVYCLPQTWEDEFFNLQNRYKRGIFSLDTALFLCNLTDRTPNQFNMTFPLNYNLTNAKNNNLICNTVSLSIYNLGIEEKKTPFGNLVKCYCAERTLCDILKPRNNSEIQIITDAFKMYVRKANKNIPLLSTYAKKLKVYPKVRSYLEVLL